MLTTENEMTVACPNCPNCNFPTVACACEATVDDKTAAKTYLVPEVKITSLVKALDSMIRRAVKLGVETCSYKLGTTVDKPYETHFSVDQGRYVRTRFEGTADELVTLERKGKISYYRFQNVTIAGPNPVLAGWEFVATLQHLRDEETGKAINLLRSRPSFEGKIPDSFKTAESTNCDHCGQRRFRNDTYLVRNVTTGAWKQIGSTCIKDFLGGIDPRVVASILEWFLETERLCSEGDEDGEQTHHGVARHSLRHALAVAAAIIRQEGWTSAKKAEEFGFTSTGMLCREVLAQPEKHLINETTEFKEYLAKQTEAQANAETAQEQM